MDYPKELFVTKAGEGLKGRLYMGYDKVECYAEVGEEKEVAVYKVEKVLIVKAECKTTAKGKE